jgi:hypothetical protein
MHLLSCPWAWQVSHSGYGFLCDEVAVLGDEIKGTHCIKWTYRQVFGNLNDQDKRQFIISFCVLLHYTFSEILRRAGFVVTSALSTCVRGCWLSSLGDVSELVTGELVHLYVSAEGCVEFL